MISFVWPAASSMLAGTGGSETYTAGQVRELLRRGIKAQVVTIGAPPTQSRTDFPGVPFLGLERESDISALDGQVVFINRAYMVPTKNQAAIILHCATSIMPKPAVMRQEVSDKIVIATSEYNARQLALYMDIAYRRIHVVLPFADPAYGQVKRRWLSERPRIIFAGRLSAAKGIYILMEMLETYQSTFSQFDVAIVAAGQHTETGRLVAAMLKHYPYATIIEAKKTPEAMARLMAETDILLMPSVFAEPFGMLAVEAQHAGCRVVASNIGGLPETNVGFLITVEPRDPEALKIGIEQAIGLGHVSAHQRDLAKEKCTLESSVDSLLQVLPELAN